ncbi:MULTISPECIES: hypothetical protein [Bacillus]|nr:MULTISPECIES: hypothetical protein [Bacillus]MCT1383920.1 hypothetical protein [Bacillus sp. p3-SID196]MCB5901131.1 hypothetical protein [Bacillus cereus]MCC2454241.1 hypothetical protein [Bacillus cereus]MCT6904507.1 hypothetical protein [Bacillus cereus]MCU4790678.1 hypothetical protein [Bacillus cereus]
MANRIKKPYTVRAIGENPVLVTM